jgi:hypothetical protein
MLEHLTPSRLRANLYRILDQILETGTPVEILCKGRRLRIVPEQAGKLDLLKPHLNFIKGKREELVHMDWSDQWHP